MCRELYAKNRMLRACTAPTACVYCKLWLGAYIVCLYVCALRGIAACLCVYSAQGLDFMSLGKAPHQLGKGSLPHPLMSTVQPPYRLCREMCRSSKLAPETRHTLRAFHQEHQLSLHKHSSLARDQDVEPTRVALRYGAQTSQSQDREGHG